MQAQAQQVTGYVTDSLTGEILVGAHILSANSKKATTTNTFGFFNISIHENDSLIVSYVGYDKEVIPVASIEALPISIKLSSNIEIDKVVITDSKSLQEKSEMGSIDFLPRKVKTLPALAGESDIMKSLQLMPGIKPMGEGQSSFMVRGGSPDQNLIILDNVPIYYINHLGGFVSVFNTDALKNVKMYKGAFPAQYGGRLSSITDITTKDGNMNEKHSSLTLGLVSSKLMLEGPLKKDTLSYFISGRRFMYDLLTRPITYLTNDKEQMGYTFYDLNAKLNYKPDNKNRFYWSFYSGHDKMLTKRKINKDEKSLMKNKGRWGNLTSAFRWNHLYGKNLFSNMSLYYMQYTYNSNFKYAYQDDEGKMQANSDFESGISDIALKTDFEYYPVTNLNLTFGTRHISHTYTPNNYNYSQPVHDLEQNSSVSFNHSQKSNAFENAVYLEADYSPFNPITFNLGYRMGTFTTEEKTYISHEPRVILNTNIPDLLSVKASYAEMSQYVHLLSYFSSGIPADLWMPSTESVPPQNSQIYSVGLYKDFIGHGLEFSVEGYYKEMNHLIDYKPGYNIFNSDETWTESIEKGGEGISKGVEFLLKRKTGRLTGWVSYTLSRTTRQFDNLNNGKPYPYMYDATHDISIVGNYKLKKQLTISATWSYLTGRAITLPNEYYDTPAIRMQNEEYTFGMNRNQDAFPAVNYNRIASSYEEKNAVRMNPYHQLDISLTYRTHKKNSDRVLNLGVYNLYNRQNAVYYYTGSKEEVDEMGNPTGASEGTVYQISMFPIIPSISYSWIW